MGGMNLGGLGAGVGQGVQLGGGVEFGTAVPQPSGDAAANTNPILGGENVVVTTPSAVEKMLHDAAFETAENTIKNLCDTPEESAAKQERAEEEREKEITQEEIDKQVQQQQMRDEIATEKQEKV